MSLYHWAAAALLRRLAGLAESQQECIDDPGVADLRSCIEAIVDPKVGRNQAIVEASFAHGRKLRSHVTDVRGSATRPMTDEELDAKFRGQAAMVLPAQKVEQLLALCRDVASLSDVGWGISAALDI